MDRSHHIGVLKRVENGIEAVTHDRCAMESECELTVAIRMIAKMSRWNVRYTADRSRRHLDGHVVLEINLVGLGIVSTETRNDHADDFFVSSNSELFGTENRLEILVCSRRSLRSRTLPLLCWVPFRSSREVPEDLGHGSWVDLRLNAQVA